MQLDKFIDRLEKKLDSIQRVKEQTEMQEKEAPEERYQREKKQWYFHESSWYLRGLNKHDGKGCNHYTGCIPECFYYAGNGRIEKDEDSFIWNHLKTNYNDDNEDTKVDDIDIEGNVVKTSHFNLFNRGR